jgi:hypothetical protein
VFALSHPVDDHAAPSNGMHTFQPSARYGRDGRKLIRISDIDPSRSFPIAETAIELRIETALTGPGLSIHQEERHEDILIDSIDRSTSG